MRSRHAIARGCFAVAGLGIPFAIAAGPVQEKGVGDVLLIVTQGAGILLLLGTMVLLFYRRVFIDAESKQPIKFTLPVLGEISTQSPVVLLILIGAAMVTYPLTQMRAAVVSLEGSVDTGGETVSVLIVAVPDYQQIRHTPGTLKTNIPLLNTNASYRALFIVDKQIIAEQDASLEGGRIKLNSVQWVPPPRAGPESEIRPRKEISDDEAARLLR
jgi:hypothetical protein